MPVKRRTPKGRDHRITPAAVEAYRAKDWLALHRPLGLKPWEASPLNGDFAALSKSDLTPWAASLPQAAALRRQLEEQL